MAKNKMGRPPLEYKEEYAALAITLMREGASKTEVAFELAISRDTFYMWCETIPDFSDAIKKGVDYSEGCWMKEGRKNLHNKEFNSTLWYMNMKNRFGWKDKTESVVTATVKHEDALKELE